MAPRSVGTASIAFSLVNIPVKIHSSSSPASAISFKQLSPEGHRVKQQYIDPQNDDRVVPRSEMVKGYEWQKDSFVIFTAEEVKSLQEQSTQVIEIKEFLPREKIPTTYIDKTYYLSAGRGGDRAYALLSQAMGDQCGLATYSARGKQHLMMLEAEGGLLIMHQLSYADEIVPPSEIPVPDVEPAEAEVELAKKLMASLTTEEFEPEKYKDVVKERILKAVEEKKAGKTITVEAPAPKAEVSDLMAALQASLG